MADRPPEAEKAIDSDASTETPGGGAGGADSRVRVSLIIPCYNEEDLVEDTIPPLLMALAVEEPECEVVVVDNGSTDGTGAAIDRLCALDPRFTRATVPTNKGYGLGVLTGYRAAGGDCIGHIPADGPVDPADVASLARHALDSGPGTLITAERENRQDTWVRKLVSGGYNLLFRVVFGVISRDINGTPKFVHREDLGRLALRSTDYFLEAEMLLKARRYDIDIERVSVPSQARPGGESKVSARLIGSILEFVRNMMRYRFGSW